VTSHSVTAVAEAAIRLAQEADRDRAIEQLIEQARDRRCLEDAHALFVARLYRRSDDFDATLGLRLVLAALQRLPYGDDSTVALDHAKNSIRRRRRWLPRRR
jgi:hypothetical protein